MWPSFSTTRSRLALLCAGAALLQGAVAPLLAQEARNQSAPDTAERRVVATRLGVNYPMPEAPVPPVRPSPPGVAGSLLTGLLLGGGAFVGSSTPCGAKEFTSPSPYGGFFKGEFVAAGKSVKASASPACTVGIAAGTAALTSIVMQMTRRSGFRGRLAVYEGEALRYPTQKASYDRAVALRARSLDSAVTATIAESTRRATEARQLAEQNRLEAAARVAVAPVPAGDAPLPLMTPPVTGLKNPDAVAVVIGNRRYQRTEVPSVDFAERDAQTMRQFLMVTFGFREENIIFEANASFSTLQRIFGSRDDHKGQLYNYLTPAATSDVFVFYSGHGAPDPGTGTAYLVPADADPQSLRLTGYPLRQLYENVSKLPARSLTIVLDACFSGLTERGSLLRGVSPLSLRVENPVLAAPNAVVLSASMGTEVSGWYDQQQQGLFTYYFLDALTKVFSTGIPSQVPTARMIGSMVTPEVNRLSRRLRSRDQTPQVFGQASDVPLLFVRPK